jgi:cell division GTPase FtsZ
VVPNDRIFTVIGKDTPIVKAFEAIDEILRNALKGIVEIIAMPGIINVDFADVKSIIQDAGIAIVGVGQASGPDRAVKAVTAALHSPLLETSPEGAKAVLIGITGGRDLRMTEVNDAAKIVAQTADPGARIIFGAYYDRSLKPGQLKVTVVAAGFNSNQNGTLFGTNHFESSRQGMFARPGVSGASALSTGTDSAKKPFSGVREPGTTLKEPTTIHPRGEESADQLMSQKMTPPSMNSGGNSKSQAASTNKEKENDAWDIPAFLRRRKR